MRCKYKSRNIHCESVFHSVGQGLFYSMKLDNFNMVYDCGSKAQQPLTTEINNFKNGISGVLDLLIISHFHDDHVSGLDTLLINTRVKRLLIPYLTPVERLYLSVQHSEASASYHRFLADPTGTLLELTDIDEIIVVGSAPPDDENNIDFEPEFPEPHPNKEGRDIDSLLEESDIPDFILGDDGYKIPSNRAKYLEYYGNWVMDKRWEFQIFRPPTSFSDLYRFLKHLLKNGIDPRNQSQVLNAILNQATRGYISNGYPTNSDHRNDTSLLLYHGPRNQKKITYRWSPIMYPFVFWPYNRSSFGEKYFGHLLTGDINLNTRDKNNKKYVDEICQYYANKSDDVVVGLLPHHGSNRNWNLKMLSDFPNCYNWVASAKSSSTHHPGRKVLLDLVRNGKYVFLCDENQSIELTADIHY